MEKPEFNPTPGSIKPVQPEKATEPSTLDLLQNKKEITSVIYEDIGVSETDFKEAVIKLPLDEETKERFDVFIRYLKSPVIKDSFNNYGDRRVWGIETLNEENIDVGKLYKSNKISRGNIRKLNNMFDLLTRKKYLHADLTEAENKQKEMRTLFRDVDHFESLSFEDKKKIADMASELSRMVCNAVIADTRR